MKIIKSKLKQIIKEELEGVLSEGKMSPEAIRWLEGEMQRLYKVVVIQQHGDKKKAVAAIAKMKHYAAAMDWPAWQIAEKWLKTSNIENFIRYQAEDAWGALPTSAKAKILAARSAEAVKAAIKRLPPGLLKGLPILGWGLTVIEVADFLADEYYDNYSKRLNPDDEEIEDVEQRFKDVSEPWDPETQTFPSEREEERKKSVRARLQGTRN